MRGGDGRWAVRGQGLRAVPAPTWELAARPPWELPSEWAAWW